jgi:hypothetical protein
LGDEWQAGPGGDSGLQVEAGKCRCGGVRRRGCRWSLSSLRQGASQGSRVASERVMGVQDWWLQDGGLG